MTVALDDDCDISVTINEAVKKVYSDLMGG